MKPLAEGVRIYDYYEGMFLPPYGHKCVVCSAIHPCTIDYLTIPNLETYTVEGHNLTCSLTGSKYRIGKGERDSDGVLTLTNRHGGVLKAYPIYADGAET